MSNDFMTKVSFFSHFLALLNIRWVFLKEFFVSLIGKIGKVSVSHDSDESAPPAPGRESMSHTVRINDIHDFMFSEKQVFHAHAFLGFDQVLLTFRFRSLENHFDFHMLSNSGAFFGLRRNCPESHPIR